MEQVNASFASLKAAHLQRLKAKVAKLESEISETTGIDRLLDTLIIELGLPTDAALCRELGRRTSEISKMRHGALGLTSSFILSVHENVGWPVARIRELASAE